MKYSLKKQSGMTLTESLLVLAVGALIAVLAYGAYRMATSDVKVQSQVQGITQLVGKIKQVFASAADFSGVTNTSVTNAKIVPADFKVSGTTISNAWGGTITAAQVTGDATKFQLTITKVPKEGCMEFLAGIASAAQSMTMGGTSVKAVGASFDTSAASTQCAAVDVATAATENAVLVAQ